MNHWTNLSIEFANQKNYLDELFKVYPSIPNCIRNINNGVWEKIEQSFNQHNNIELVNSLLKCDLFPIKDSYIAYLKRDKSAIERNPQTVNRIAGAICNALDEVKYQYENLDTELCREVSFITSQELEDMYPEVSPKERENLYVKEHKTAFIMQIGDLLASGEKHDGRAPDYDDWKLNGDLLFWHEPLQCALEISSMGIRVDEKSLDEQLTKAGCDERRKLPFHKMLLEGKLPLTIGGGIGQSRICMLLLKKAHIGEVQSSIWDEKTIKVCEKAGIEIL